MKGYAVPGLHKFAVSVAGTHRDSIGETHCIILFFITTTPTNSTRTTIDIFVFFIVIAIRMCSCGGLRAELNEDAIAELQ